MENSSKKPATVEPVFIEIGKTIDIGVIDETAADAANIKAAPIRLCEGFGGPKGYGQKHIEENEARVEQLKNLGFKNLTEAVAAVAAGWTSITVANEGNRVVLVLPHRGRQLRLVVQLCLGLKGNYWSAVTIIPGRRAKPEDILYEKGKDDKGEKVTAE